MKQEHLKNSKFYIFDDSYIIEYLEFKFIKEENFEAYIFMRDRSVALEFQKFKTHKGLKYIYEKKLGNIIFVRPFWSLEWSTGEVLMRMHNILESPKF